jgi:hypothetical protein
LLALRRKQDDEFEAMEEAHSVSNHGSKIELCFLVVGLRQEKFQVDHFSGTEVAGNDSAHPGLCQLKAAAMNADFAIVSEHPHHDGELGAIPGKAAT